MVIISQKAKTHETIPFLVTHSPTHSSVIISSDILTYGHHPQLTNTNLTTEIMKPFGIYPQPINYTNQ